jgi:hypothetical protein
MAIDVRAYDYQNIKTEIGATKVKAKSVSWSESVESEKIYGSGRKALDYTDGRHTVEDGTAVLEWAEWRNLIGEIGPGFMRKRKRFDWALIGEHEGNPVITDVLKSCRIIGSSHDGEEGPDPLEVEFTFQVLDVEHGTENGGIDPFADE